MMPSPSPQFSPSPSKWIRCAGICLASIAILALPGLHAEEQAATSTGPAVKITRDMDHVTVMHNGKPFNIVRNQDTKATINPAFAKTSRKCPPFCVQPMKLAPGVETIGTREMLDYLKQRSDGNDSILVIDSRTRPWVKRGTIPGSINIPYKTLSLKHNEAENIEQILEEEFGVLNDGTFHDFSYAKTLVLFCNGMWCGQAPTNIKTLLRLGYPPHKLKWYRGGMQVWELLGLSTVKPGDA